MKRVKARKQVGKKKKSTAFSSWAICIYVWAKWLLPSEKQQQGQLSSQAASHNHLPTLQPPPNPTSALPRGQRPSHASNNGRAKKSRKVPSCKDSPKQGWLLQKSAFVFNGSVPAAITCGEPWLKLEINQVQREEEGKRGTERSVEHVLCEHSGSEAGQGRCWNSSGGSPALPALPDMGKSRLPWWRPAGQQCFISALFLPQFLSCGRQQQQERRKNVCILMAAGSLNSVSEKNKENVVRDRETNQGGSYLLRDVLSTNSTFCGWNPLSLFFFFGT